MSFAARAQDHAAWAMAALGWTPDAVRAATPQELRLAWRGWCALHGLADAALHCGRAELQTLMTQLPD